MTPIDLRSDTVTRPSDAMRAAMASAPVGDDQFGEDPTVNGLQEMVAARLGKEAALWLPSGTMANQVGLRTLTRPGDDVVVPAESHLVWHETGGGAANSGVQFTQLAPLFTAAEFEAARKPADHMVYPPTTVVWIENTHNRAGGVVVPQEQVDEICNSARQAGISSFMDGARLWNAAVAAGRSPAEIARPFDLVSVAFTKGLGAPGGSMLAGGRDLIARATRYRRMAGGAMRQAGILAAGAAYGLEHHCDRLAEDHANARTLAERLADGVNVAIDLATVQTNIVVFSLREAAPATAAVIDRARERGVLLMAFGPRTLRLVTHLDVTREQCRRAADVLFDIVEGR